MLTPRARTLRPGSLAVPVPASGVVGLEGLMNPWLNPLKGLSVYQVQDLKAGWFYLDASRFD